MAREAFAGHLDLLLLSAIDRKPNHGYAIIDHVRSASAGAFEYAEGTVYPALRRLEDQGLVRSKWVAAEGRRRRIYELTRRGRRELDEKTETWRRYAASVEAVIGA
jgi:transcriptional regulator